MAINYSMTKESEKTLKKLFFKFYAHVNKPWKKLEDIYKLDALVRKEFK